jgi:hypothetical protein
VHYQICPYHILGYLVHGKICSQDCPILLFLCSNEKKKIHDLTYPIPKTVINDMLSLDLCTWHKSSQAFLCIIVQLFPKEKYTRWCPFWCKVFCLLYKCWCYVTCSDTGWGSNVRTSFCFIEVYIKKEIEKCPPIHFTGQVSFLETPIFLWFLGSIKRRA